MGILKNGNFGEKWKFWRKMGILEKNGNFEKMEKNGNFEKMEKIGILKKLKKMQKNCEKIRILK